MVSYIHSEWPNCFSWYLVVTSVPSAYCSDLVLVKITDKRYKQLISMATTSAIYVWLPQVHLPLSRHTAIHSKWHRSQPKFCCYACRQCLLECFSVAQGHQQATQTVNIDGDDDYHRYVTTASTLSTKPPYSYTHKMAQVTAEILWLRL